MKDKPLGIFRHDLAGADVQREMCIASGNRIPLQRVFAEPC